MASTTLTVSYRPLRIGFCVNENNINEIILAAQINTILWGGIYNPIIPVGSNKRLSSALVKLFNVDFLYAVNETENLKQFIEKYEKGELPNLFHALIFQQDQRNYVRNGVLDISNIIDRYWDKEINSSRTSDFVLPKWEQTDPLDRLFNLEFGSFPSQYNSIYKYEEAYKIGLKARIVKIAPTAQIPVKLAHKTVPIVMTTDNLEVILNMRVVGRDGIFIGDHTKASDLMNYWNVRASGTHLSFVPVQYTERVVPYVKDYFEDIKQHTQNSPFYQGANIWYDPSLGEEIVKTVSANFLAQNEVRTHHRINSLTWEVQSDKPGIPTFENLSVLASVDKESSNSPSISFQLPQKPFNKNTYNNRQLLAFDFDPITQFEYIGYTLKLPDLTDLNEWYSRKITFNPDSLRLTNGKPTLIIQVHDQTEKVFPIRNQELILKLFERSGITAKSSQAGHITQRLIEQMGKLDNCRVFKITGVRKLMDQLSANTLTTRGNATRVIWDEDPVTHQSSFTKHERLFIQQRTQPNLTTSEVFDFLIEKNVFRVGLEPTCPNCNLSFWLAIKDARDEVQCEYCGYTFKIAMQLRGISDWKFRRSGLFGKDNNQEGALPVILTLMQLERRSSWDRFAFSTALKLDSTTLGIDCETDFAVIDSNSHNDQVNMAIGECKTRDEITDEDIHNLTLVKNALEAKGIKVHLLFAKAVAFTGAEIQRFKALRAKNIYPILFTDHDLEPDELYNYYRENRITLPAPYSSDFDSLAANSAHIYLQ